MDSAPTRVYVVDDDSLLRNSLARLLEQAECQPQTFDSGAAFLVAYPDLSPGCIIMDLMMPDMTGLELQRRLVGAGCRWPMIVLTGHGDHANVSRAVTGGAIAFLEKPVRQVELYAVILRAEGYLAGAAEVFPDPELAQRLAQLSPRESQVLTGVLEKKISKEIAAELGLSESTVKGYRRKAMSKLGAKNTAELVMLALRGGFGPKPRS